MLVFPIIMLALSPNLVCVRDQRESLSLHAFIPVSGRQASMEEEGREFSVKGDSEIESALVFPDRLAVNVTPAFH